MTEQLRLPAEATCDAEIAALKAGDDAPKPAGWMLSPQAVVTYLIGGREKLGAEISPEQVSELSPLKGHVTCIVGIV